MKITFASRGGQAAGILLHRPPIVIDATAFEASKAAELRALVAAASSAPPPPRSSKTRDEMSYSITIDDAGTTTTLSQSDTAMTTEFRRLMSWLQSNSR